jgi:hypothetical protein
VVGVQANQESNYSIPINGRYSILTIPIQIPPTPRWAHDVVLNASIAWNQAQAWYQQVIFPTANTYTLIESTSATATISFTIPQAYAGFAVGWTVYQYAPTSKTTIISSQTYLDPFLFSPTQENNMTARQLAFRLAIHELGRILGLGSVLDGRDVMDPRNTLLRAAQPPMISTLDLYAVHILAGGSAPSFVTLPSDVQNQMIDARTFLSSNEGTLIPTPEFNNYYGLVAAIGAISASLTLRRKR